MYQSLLGKDPRLAPKLPKKTNLPFEIDHVQSEPLEIEKKQDKQNSCSL